MKTKTELTQLLQDVASALGGTFDNKNYEGEAKGRITLADGVKFFVSADDYGNKGKLHISSSYPHHVVRADGSTQGTSQREFSNAPHFDGINVSHDKTATQVAADITRRFLPTYAPLYAAAVAYCERQAAYYAGQKHLGDVAAEVLKPHGYGQSTYVRARVDYVSADYVNVKVDDLNEDQLRKLADFLKTL